MARKVVFVNRFYYPDQSATSQMLTDLAVRLADAGVPVHVICSRQLYENATAKLPRCEVIRGVHVHRVWTSTYGRSSLRGRAVDYASFYLSATAYLGSLLRAGDVAVVKTDPPMLSVFAAIAVAVRRAKLVNWLQDVFPEVATRLGVTKLNPVLLTGLQAMRDRSLAFAKANVVLGTLMRDYLKSRDIDADRLHIIENWSDSAAAAPKTTAQSELRERLELRNKFLVGYSGNLGRAHEHETIVAAANLLRDHADIAFLMVGGGAKMQLLQHLVAESGLDNFHFLPYQPRESLADSMAAADVHLACLLPDLEGLIVPSKVYGILAASRPVVFIGAARGEIAQLIQEAGCGESVRCGDGAGLARVLLELRNNPVRAEMMGRAGRSTFETRFTVERAVGRWKVLLDDMGISANNAVERHSSVATECERPTSA
jgi:glycosyltransferase involved in cell wall biosynthesis